MSDYSRLLEILATLIGIQTTSGNADAVSDCYDYIVKLLENQGLFVNRYVSNGFESLVISTQDTKHPKVLLQAHVDVVPGYKKQFKLKQQEGKLYGRGVYDMKFAVACFVHLFEDIKPELANYDVAIMLTSDEEVNGLNGVDYLIRQGYGADVCVLPDSGEDWNVEASAKGFAVAELLAKGKSAHGARPWEADNAAVKLLDFLAIVSREFPFTSPLDTTMSLTRMSAGPAYNQIPGEASATFDIRYPDESHLEAIKTQLARLCHEHDIKVDFTVLANSVLHDVSSPYVEAWQAITTKVTGKETTYTHSFAASDARYLVPRGITTISARPLGAGHHGPEEWIAEQDFYEYYEVVKQFVLASAAKQI